MIDTHAHLTDRALAVDIDDVLHRAREAGVQAVICVTETPGELGAACALAARHVGLVHAAVGLHPCAVAAAFAAAASVPEAERQLDDSLAALRAVAARGKWVGGMAGREPGGGDGDGEEVENETEVVAVGEVGLDFTPRVLAMHPDGADAMRAAQEKYFRGAVRAAVDAGLPLSVHSRGAGRHALAVLQSECDRIATTTSSSSRSSSSGGGVGGGDSNDDEGNGDSLAFFPWACMHAFDGRAVHAERALASMPAGAVYFSIAPVAAREAGFRKLAARVPLARLLLESDAPALAPVRGERNEPKNVATAARVVADAKGIEVEEAVAALTQNARALFTRLPAR